MDRSLNGRVDTADVVGSYINQSGRAARSQVVSTFGVRSQSDRHSGRLDGIVRGPALSNLDLAAFKNFQVKERFKLQFRAEFFNTLNHPVLGNPNTTFTNGNFGKILGTQTAPRVGEMGLKLLF